MNIYFDLINMCGFRVHLEMPQKYSYHFRIYEQSFLRARNMFVYAYFHYHIINLFKRLIPYAFFGHVLAVSFQIMLLLPLCCLADLMHILWFVSVGGAATKHSLFLAHTINSVGTNSVDCHKEKSLFYMSNTCTTNSHIEST